MAPERAGKFKGAVLSVRELSVQTHIAIEAAQAELCAVKALGGTDREAIVAYYEVLTEILRIGRLPCRS